MKNIIETTNRQWNDMTTLKPDEALINQHLYRLEQVDLAYAAKWGVGKLPHLVTNALAQKWQNQQIKLTHAIKNKDHRAVTELVAGYVKGYEMLEAEAIRLGHVPNPPDVWEVAHESGRVYKIVKNDIDAIRVMDEGGCVYTLQEVVRILDANQLVNKVKDTFPAAKIEKVEFDFTKGDSLDEF